MVMGISFLEGPAAWLMDEKGRERRAETREVGQARLVSTRRVSIYPNQEIT